MFKKAVALSNTLIQMCSLENVPDCGILKAVSVLVLSKLALSSSLEYNRIPVFSLLCSLFLPFHHFGNTVFDNVSCCNCHDMSLKRLQV